MGSGKLLGWLGVLIYAIFTLLPGSSTEMLRWPWVLIWQVGLVCMVVIVLLNLWQRKRPFYLLGNNLDWAIALVLISLCLSTIFAPFPAQAFWSSLICLGVLTSIYVVNNYLCDRTNDQDQLQDHKKSNDNLEQILNFQAGLGFVLIVESLLIWLILVLLPKLNDLNQLTQLGMNFTFDFSEIESRNWAPFGHQNYVAGYLVLLIPLLISRAIVQTGIWRKIWSVGIILGLIDLYTTSSRGGFLGLSVLLVAGLILLLWQSSISRLWILFGSGSAIALVIVLISFNNRLRSLITGLSTGSGELFFRQITSVTGWRMGLDHPLVGAGLGAVPLLYQKYRPVWANREAEMVFQLHSTPAQIWAELGIFGAIAVFLTVAVLIKLFVQLHQAQSWRESARDRVITYGLFGSLLAYGVMAITDYQLDILPISGSMAIACAGLAYMGQLHLQAEVIDQEVPALKTSARIWIAATSTIFTLVAIAWVVPVDLAWQSSSLGFVYLDRAKDDMTQSRPESAQENFNKFKQKLQQSYELASWESYYPYQLGWNLAEIGARSRVNSLQTEGLDWLKKAIAVNPHQEFGYNSAAWVSLANNLPIEAEQYFRKGLELVSTKRSLKFGLGVSLLRQNKTAEGIKAIAEEWQSDPILITSPLWQGEQWQQLLPQITAQFDQIKTNQVTAAAAHWWLGKPGAIAELKASKQGTAMLLADAIAGKPEVIQSIIRNPTTPAQLAIAAWFKRDQALQLLEKGWIIQNRSGLDQRAKTIIAAMSDRLNKVSSFDQWLRQPLALDSPLIVRSRRSRAGFNTISRHIDGVDPQDFFPVQQNAMILTFFPDLFQ